MQYRREIDGLRALAVVPVLFFHAGMPMFGGGFVGVDVFFVISGYLITSIIVAEQRAGSFTLLKFYERRARRILPALYLVMLACLPLAWLWLIPADMKNFSESLVAVSLFSSNILFFLTTGYFGTTAEFKPLLHTWSLAVEEQYYLLFPLLLMLLLSARFRRRHAVIALVALAVASLALAQFEVRLRPVFSFFLLPTRAWELLVGSLVALLLSSDRAPPGPRGRGILAAAGLLALVYALAAFDKDTPYPSLHTLVPTLGTAALILGAGPHNAVGRLLGSRVLVGLGLISYSAYLWHQPLFAFARHRGIEEPGKGLMALLIVAALLLAALSWRFVELPLRDRRRFSARQVFVFSGCGMVFFIALGLIGRFGGGFASRYTAQQLQIAAYSEYDFDKGIRRYSCYLEPENTFKDFSRDCADTTASGGPAVLVWGDSYAAALMPGIRALRSNVIQYTASKCAPVIELAFADRPHCEDINRFVLGEVQRLQPAELLLHGNWHVYGGAARVALGQTLRELRRVAPGTRITLIGGVPQWRRTLPILALKAGLNLDEQQVLAMPAYRDLNAVDTELRRLAAEHGAGFRSALDALCVAGSCLAVMPYQGHHELTAWDNGHLTEAGSMLLARRLLADDAAERKP